MEFVEIWLETNYGNYFGHFTDNETIAANETEFGTNVTIIDMMFGEGDIWEFI